MLLTENDMQASNIAHYILSKLGGMTAMKLQKLLFYCQAWSLVWDDRPMFNEKIEAWANGPVIPEIYALHRGQFSVSKENFGTGDYTLDAEATDTIDVVLKSLGDKSGHWLSELTHSEAPWIDARVGMTLSQRGNVEITQSAMLEYYQSI